MQADGSMPHHDVSHELTFSAVRLRTSAELAEVLLCLMMGACLGRRVKSRMHVLLERGVVSDIIML